MDFFVSKIERFLNDGSIYNVNRNNCSFFNYCQHFFCERKFII
jgi:hypothetical protein